MCTHTHYLPVHDAIQYNLSLYYDEVISERTFVSSTLTLSDRQSNNHYICDMTHEICYSYHLVDEVISEWTQLINIPIIDIDRPLYLIFILKLYHLVDEVISEQTS